MYKLVKPGRVFALTVIFFVIISVYLVFLYRLQIIEGEKYYNQSNEISTEEKTVTAARGNILDRYGRILISNKECYNIKIDTTKLFASDDPNRVILELVNMVRGYGDDYTDDLPITNTQPFEYDPNMTEIQRTMLKAYFKDKSEYLSEDPTAVELMSYMRTRYEIDNSYTAEEMRLIAGVRYSINVRYAINTADYIFVEDASMGLISSIMENKLTGIQVSRAYVRDYNTDYAAHLLGYVGLMTQEEFEKYSLKSYANDAYVGKDGVEYAFEDYLHGKDGKVEETRNAAGTILSTVYTQEPEPGNHVYLTIDSVLQEQTERILANGITSMRKTRATERAEGIARGDYDPEIKDEITGGAAVVVNVKTGEPLAIASYPTYDVSTVIDKYAELLQEENAPLFNRALMGAYAPGSAFKPCTAIASLTEGIINTETKVKCEGVFTKYAAEGYAPECWIWQQGYTHPEENVSTALRDSCNYFFYTCGNDLGVDRLGEYALKLGLGSSTGIELVETKGNMSNRANHADYTGTEWRIGDSLQAAIGQSDSIFSPLQIAEYCATVANNGKRYSASILKAIRTYDYSNKIYEREPEPIAVVESPQYNWDAIHEGMWMVLNSPWNEQNYLAWIDCKWTCAGKTGTAQKGEGITNDGIFMCYGPYKDPQIAIAIIVERGGAGAQTQFMAREIMDVYINICSYSDSSEAEMTLLR
ncbi:MAG: penicillin-binding transpeptidase domain-containing protein [Eubacteriales bacterium]|nr:penicillin-binding transpeptidase domain-containing protein [Eubacteriales bacterium]